MGCIGKMGVGRPYFPGEFVHCIVPDEDAIWNVEHAVVCVELFDGGAPADRITLSEYLLKVSMEKFNNSFSRRHIHAVLLRGVNLSDASGQTKRTAVRFDSRPASNLRGSPCGAQTDKSRRSLATWPVALTLYCARAIFPFSSTTKLERITPWTALPYIIFSP